VGALHLQFKKSFSGPVKRIHKTAMAFHKYAYLATGLLLRSTDSGNNALLFCSSKKRLFLKKGKYQLNEFDQTN
jgi:hypothetical protein